MPDCQCIKSADEVSAQLQQNPKRGSSYRLRTQEVLPVSLRTFFILVTDHKPLLALLSPSKETPALAANRLARWPFLVSQFDFKIEFRRTSEHANADALSRLPVGYLSVQIPISTEKKEVKTQKLYAQSKW